MDNKALNEEVSYFVNVKQLEINSLILFQSSEESEYEDDSQFESKVDYTRFMSLLKDSMNDPENKTRIDSGNLYLMHKIK